MAEPFPLAPALWAATAPPAPATPSLETSAPADVSVIGAGYTGLATALALAERGIQTIVLEAREPGWGDSGRNCGTVMDWPSCPSPATVMPWRNPGGRTGPSPVGISGRASIRPRLRPQRRASHSRA